MPPEMIAEVDKAVAAGMSVINGLHEHLGPRYPELSPGQWIWDIRQEPQDLGIAWARAAGLQNRRALLVGTDMAVGKMTITDCHLSIKGTKFRLDKDYVVRAFRGTMGELKNQCVVGVMQRAMSDSFEHKKEKVLAHRQEKFEAKKEYVQEKKQQAKDFVAERVELRKTQLKSMFGSKKAEEPAAN